MIVRDEEFIQFDNVTRQLDPVAGRLQKLAQLGINYDFEGYTKENGDKAAFPATTKKTAAKSKAAKA